VATSAGRDALLEVTLAPQFLAQRDLLVVLGGSRGQLLAGKPGGDVFHVFVGQWCSHAAHDGVISCCRLAVDGFEILQLLVEIFLNLASQVRVGRCGAVAVGAMAGDTNGLGNGFPLAGSAFALAPSEAWVTKLVARRIAIAAVRIIFELLMRVL
jgi:hypothetical protein